METGGDDPVQPESPAGAGEGSLAEPAVALSVRDLTKKYEDTVAVDQLSFDVRAGEILGLVGPNGAGKTTSLRSIVGVLPLQVGRVTVAGFDLENQEVEAKKTLAWVPDDPQPFETLTVHEHLEFTAQLYGVEDWEAEGEQLLEQFELMEKRDALGGELSRGMRQKLAFCCSWISRPKVILMDEPLSGLDPRGIRAAKDAIRRVAASGAAVVLSSHLLELIEELADKLLIINRGCKVFHGTLADARTNHADSADSRLEEIFMAITEGETATPATDNWPT
ncbi:MAG: ABC-2 type transport system ATP-binding protein [Candidatus Paceibacteria bacterium]|jgi:ABC-2 type transport system ATP-binding protein